VLREALDKAISIPTNGASQVPLSYNRFITALQGEKTSFEKQLQSYGFQKDEINDIQNTVAAMSRAGHCTQQKTINGIKVPGVKFLSLRKISIAMAKPEGRIALRVVSYPKSSPQAVIAAERTLMIGRKND